MTQNGNGNVLIRGNDFSFTGGPQVVLSGTAPSGFLSRVIGDVRETGTGAGFLMEDPSTHALRFFGSADADLQNPTSLTDATKNVAYTTTTSGIGPAAGLLNSLTIDAGDPDGSALSVAGTGGSLTITTGDIQFIGNGQTQSATISGFDGGIMLGAGLTNYNIIVGNVNTAMSATIASPFASGVGTSVTKIGQGNLFLTADQSGKGIGSPSFTGNMYLLEGVLGIVNPNALTSANSVTMTGGILSISNNIGATVSLGTVTASVGVTTAALSIGTNDSVIAANLGGTFNTTLSAGSTLTFGSGGTSLTVTGTVTGPATSNFVKTGAGTEIWLGTINMTNSNTGLVRIDGGSLAFNTRTLATSIISNSNIAVNSAGILSITSSITGVLVNDNLLMNGGTLNFTTSTTALNIVAMGGSITANLGQSTFNLTNSNTTGVTTLTGSASVGQITRFLSSMPMARAPPVWAGEQQEAPSTSSSRRLPLSATPTPWAVARPLPRSSLGRFT